MRGLNRQLSTSQHQLGSGIPLEPVIQTFGWSASSLLFMRRISLLDT
jgi:hypothetical protein